MSTPDYDACVDALDQTIRNFEGQELAVHRFIDEICSHVWNYVHCSEDARDDVELLFDYALAAAGSAETNVLFGDRSAGDQVERRLERLLFSQKAEALFDNLVERLQKLRFEDPARLDDELITLLGQGGRTRPDLFLFRPFGTRLIDWATVWRRPEALEAAVDPAGEGWAQLGHPDRDLGSSRRAAFDGLGELGAVVRSSVGRRALDILVRLCDHPETALDAAIRLPPWLLTDDDRYQLGAALDHHTELLESDPLSTCLPDDWVRIPVVLRSVLFLAADARQLPNASV